MKPPFWTEEEVAQVSGAGVFCNRAVKTNQRLGSFVPRRDIPRFVALYKASPLPVEKLLTRTIELEEINEAFDALAGEKRCGR